MTQGAPRISVVIPFHNRRAEAARCLEAVLAQRLPGGGAVEVIAVDNNSTDGTAEELARFAVRVVRCETPGPAAARNAGIRAARAPVVAMTDSDCVPTPRWLEFLLQPFDDPAMLAAGGRICAFAPQRGVALFAERYEVLHQHKFFLGGPGFPPFFATANAAYRRDALVEVGGFDERLRVGEDADLCWRLLDLGGKLAYCHWAAVLHEHRNTYAALFRQAWHYGASAPELFAKHRGRFGRRFVIQWKDYPVLALLPLKALGLAVIGHNGFERRWGLYEAVYRTGYTLGRYRGAWRHRVLYL
jgi:GT2 family glycosyltransferase